jgi:hypothetical protein
MPNRPNPNYPAYTSSPYLDDNGNPTNDPGTAAPNTNVDIAPGAQTQTQQPAAGPAQPTAPGTNVPRQGAVTGIGGAPGTPGGNAQVDQITLQSRQEISDANAQVTEAYNTLAALQAKFADPATSIPDKDLISNQIVAAQTQLSTASNRVATANAAYSSTVSKALDTVTLTPEQATLYKAQAGAADAQAATATAQAKVLTDGAPGQRDLVTQQAGLASAQATAAITTANAAAAKTPQEQAALQAQANQANAQADQINTLLPAVKAKADAEVGLTQAQTDLTGSQSDLAKAQGGLDTANATLASAQTDAQKALLPGLPAAQAATTAQAAGAGAASQANAQATLAGITQAQQGSVYGLLQKQQMKIDAINAIHQQVFGPGGSGDPKEADDLLGQANQTIDASIAGTTPYAANVAAANAGLTAFGTQASLANAAQTAMASRGNAVTALAGSALGSLAPLVANLPAGSTALAGAMSDIMGLGRQAQAQFAPPATPQAPALPALLQKLAPPGAPTGAAPGAPAGPAGAPLPMPVAPIAPPPNAGGASAMPATAQPGGNTTAPVTINIGGQGQGQQQQPAPPAGGYAQNQPGTYGQLSGGMPSMPASLQQYAPPTTDFVHQLWGNELQSGAVKSPYQAMQPQIPGPTAAPSPMPA